MTTNEENLTVLFADIVDSTGLFTQLGDQRAKALVLEGLSLLSEVVVENHGRVVKTIGDEVMAVFPNALDAVNAALFIQKLFRITKIQDAPGDTLKIRIGLNQGPVLCEGDDAFGNAVIIASRLVSQAKARQILTTANLLQGLENSFSVTTRSVDRLRLKGIPDPVHVFEILGSDDEAEGITAYIQVESGQKADDVDQSWLTLKWGNQFKKLSMADHGVSLGRDEENDIVIKSDNASRYHAKIEYNQDGFYVLDQSTNGTFVGRDDGSVIVVHRDKMRLLGEGFIGVGIRPVTNDENVVYFSIA